MVDEGLLELSPNRSWRLLDAMMGRRGYAVRTATAQMEVIGKRHYGLKAVPARRRRRPATHARALRYPAALAAAGSPSTITATPASRCRSTTPSPASASRPSPPRASAQFGAGGTALRTTQDLMLLPGLPPLVREGDRFHAEFTVRNTTARAMTVEARGIVAGLPAPLAPQTLSLGAGEAVVTGWDVAVPAGVASLGWDVEVGERGGATDHLRVTQQVLPAVPVRTLQATLFQWSPEAAPVPVARPPGRAAGSRRRHRARHAVAGRRPRRRARLDAALSVQLPRATRLTCRRARRRRGVDRDRPRAARVPGPRRPAQVLPDDGGRQRRPDRLRGLAGGQRQAVDSRRRPLDDPGRPRRLRRRQGQASVAHGGSAAAQARRAGCARAPRQGDAGAARRARRRAGALADLGRARLVERAAPHARCSRPGGAPGGSRAAGARPARPLRDDAALLVRVAGRSLVADDRAGRQRGAPRAAAPRFRCMARRPAPARARRARASSARDAGEPRPPTPGASSRSSASPPRSRPWRRRERRRRCSVASARRSRGRRIRGRGARPRMAGGSGRPDRRAGGDRRAVGDRRDASGRAAAPRRWRAGTG